MGGTFTDIKLAERRALVARPDCRTCHGHGYVTVTPCDGGDPQPVDCGNCLYAHPVGQDVPGLQEFPGVIPLRLMDMLTAFCVGVTESRLPNQEIGRSGSPYIDRWYLARKVTVPTFVYDQPGRGPFGEIPSELENVYLHGYHRGDADDPHDHPWPNVSLVVRGWYRENIYDAQANLVRCETRRPGDIVLRSAGSIHAILETSDDCLSLFATLRKEREWGFWRDGQFIHWKDFS